MSLTGDRELDELYEEVSELQRRKLGVLARARGQTTEETRGELSAIETKHQAAWARIRQRKVAMKANTRGEMVPRYPSETGLRRSRWQE